MAARQFRPFGSPAAPADWIIPDTLELLLRQVYAHYDGTGAGAAFLPCLEIIDDAGLTAAIYTAPQVAAAGSAEVTWFPGLRPAATASGGSGLMLDTFPQGTSSDWFYVETGAQGPTPPFGGTGVSFLFYTPPASLGAYVVHVDGHVSIDSINSDLGLQCATGIMTLGPGPEIDITGASNGTINLTTSGASGSINLQANTSAQMNIFANGFVDIGGNPLMLESPVQMPALPIADPGVSGQLWNSGGFVKVSP
jgi:hypothetical protein